MCGIATQSISGCVNSRFLQLLACVLPVTRDSGLAAGAEPNPGFPWPPPFSELGINGCFGQ